MEHVRAFIQALEHAGGRPGRTADVRPPALDDVYDDSLQDVDAATFFLARVEGQRKLVCWGDGRAAGAFSDKQPLDDAILLIDCSDENVAGLHRTFPFTKPTQVMRHAATIGTGDRLGLATPGHVRAVRPYDALPILAQQSIRELTLTQRSYPDVIAAASWGVLQAGWTRGYGADGDHLKTLDEVSATLDQGATLITLDCSDYIDAGTGRQDQAADLADLQRETGLDLDELERMHLGHAHEVSSATGRRYQVTLTRPQLIRAVRTYGRALAFARRVHDELISRHQCDFELSIDETQAPTDPAEHLFIALTLRDWGVRVASVAPRFCGEFQKGIDYIGDLAQFERELAIHAALADHFGYKLSIHSGSDKFSVFPLIGRHTRGRVHVKTAGTSWLEALRLVAQVDPALFREICAFSCENFAAAARYYHIGTRPDTLAPVDETPDGELPTLLDQDGYRQVLHITYGLILTGDGGARFRTPLYDLWRRHERAYDELLAAHIGRHLQTLGIRSEV